MAIRRLVSVAGNGRNLLQAEAVMVADSASGQGETRNLKCFFEAVRKSGPDRNVIVRMRSKSTTSFTQIGILRRAQI